MLEQMRTAMPDLLLLCILCKLLAEYEYLGGTITNSNIETAL